MVRISDLRLIEILEKDSRMPYTHIAKMLGVSETAVRKRVKLLEKRGVIEKYTIDINSTKIGFETKAIIGIDTEPDTYLPTLTELRKLDQIKRLYSSTGDHMILLEAWFPDSPALASFLEHIGEMRGVKRVCPAIILERLK